MRERAAQANTGRQVPGTGVTGDFKPHHVAAGEKLGPLQGQQVFFTTELVLQTTKT